MNDDLNMFLNLKESLNLNEIDSWVRIGKLLGPWLSCLTAHFW